MDRKVLEVSSLSLSYSDYLPTYLPIYLLCIYLSNDRSIFEIAQIYIYIDISYFKIYNVYIRTHIYIYAHIHIIPMSDQRFVPGCGREAGAEPYPATDPATQCGGPGRFAADEGPQGLHGPAEGDLQ